MMTRKKINGFLLALPMLLLMAIAIVAVFLHFGVDVLFTALVFLAIIIIFVMFLAGMDMMFDWDRYDK